jgi:hypothetical protein
MAAQIVQPTQQTAEHAAQRLVHKSGNADRQISD